MKIGQDFLDIQLTSLSICNRGNHKTRLFSKSTFALGKLQKNCLFLMARTLRGGGGVAWPLRKNTVFGSFKKNS